MQFPFRLSFTRHVEQIRKCDDSSLKNEVDRYLYASRRRQI